MAEQVVVPPISETTFAQDLAGARAGEPPEEPISQFAPPDPADSVADASLTPPAPTEPDAPADPPPAAVEALRKRLEDTRAYGHRQSDRAVRAEREAADLRARLEALEARVTPTPAPPTADDFEPVWNQYSRPGIDDRTAVRALFEGAAAKAKADALREWQSAQQAAQQEHAAQQARVREQTDMRAAIDASLPEFAPGLPGDQMPMFRRLFWDLSVNPQYGSARPPATVIAAGEAAITTWQAQNLAGHVLQIMGHGRRQTATDEGARIRGNGQSAIPPSPATRPAAPVNPEPRTETGGSLVEQVRDQQRAFLR